MRRFARAGVRSFVTVTLAVACLLAARPALAAPNDATEPGEEECSHDDPTVTIAVLLAIPALVAVGGITAIGGLSSEISDRYRPRQGWRVAGYVFGSLNTTIGAAGIGIHAANDGDSALFYGLAAGMVAIGVTDLALAFYGDTLLPRDSDVVISPTLFPTGDGGLAPGLAFSLTRF